MEDRKQAIKGSSRDQFLSFDVKHYRETERECAREKYGKLLEIAAALSSSSSDEEEGVRKRGEDVDDDVQVRVGDSGSKQEYRNRQRKGHGEWQHKKRELGSVGTKHGRKWESKEKRRESKEKRRKSKEKRRESKEERRQRREQWMDAVEKERRKIVEAERRGGEGRRRPQMLELGKHGGLQFVVDTHGDYGNVAFESMAREDIPTYRKMAGRSHENKDGLQLKNENSKEKYRARKRRDVKIKRSEETGFGDADYVDLHGWSQAINASDYEMEKNQLQEYLIRKTREFNIATRERPHDVELWLEFARFQVDVCNSIGSGGSRYRKNALEKKLAVLERGLSKNPASVEIMKELLETAERVRPTEEMDDRWRNAVSYFSSSTDLWKAYIRRQKQNYGLFHASFVSMSYVSACMALKSQYHYLQIGEDGMAPITAEDLGLIAMNLVHMLLECIAFHFQSGMILHAIRMIQVFLEFQFFSPEGWPEDALESMFEEFWNSGAAMLGSPEAHGWEQWLSLAQRQEQKEMSQMQKGVEGAASAAATVVGEYAVFSQGNGEKEAISGEKQQEKDGTNNIKNEMEQNGDPEAQPYLREFVRQKISQEFDAALDELESEMSQDVVTAWIQLEKEKDGMVCNQKKSEEKILEEEEEEEENVTWHCVHPFMIRIHDARALCTMVVGCLRLLGIEHPWLPSMILSPDMLDDALWLNQWNSEEQADILHKKAGWQGRPWWRQSEENQDFVSRLIVDLSFTLGEYQKSFWLPLSWQILSFKVQNNKESAPTTQVERGRSMAKVHLSQNAENIQLWSAYAIMESSNGNHKMAKKVFQKVSHSLQGPLSLETLSERTCLCNAMIICDSIASTDFSATEAEKHYPCIVLHIPSKWKENLIMSLADVLLSDKATDAHAMVISIRTNLQHWISKALRNLISPSTELYSNRVTSLVRLLELSVAFELLASSSPQEALVHAIQLYEHVLLEVENAGFLYTHASLDDFLTFEVSMYQYCTLCSFASGRVPSRMPPGQARQILLSAISHFPGNPRLLLMLCEHEAKFHSFGSLRRELHVLTAAHTDSEKRVLDFVFLVYTEVLCGSSNSTICGVIERSLLTEEARRCPLLWQMYLSITSDPSTISSIFLRSIDACPWVKALWLDGLCKASTAGAYTPRVVFEFIEGMRDKDIIVRTDLYEALIQCIEDAPLA